LLLPLFVRERDFDCVNKKCSLEFFKNVCLFQGKQPYLSNVVEFQSSRLKLLARTNTLALNTTLNRMKLRDTPICEACPYKATESLQHFLLECAAYKNIRDQCFQEIVVYALSGFHRVVALTKTTIFNH
jgi:hypothetical protein